MNLKMSKQGRIAKALSAECRLFLIEWLREPDRYFVNRKRCAHRRQAVAVPDIQGKWNVCQGTAMKHIMVLAKAELVTVHKRDTIKWVSRSSRGIAAAKAFGYCYIS
jgi:hypothetical protein